jgi:cytochrome c oxidase subunit 2
MRPIRTPKRPRAIAIVAVALLSCVASACNGSPSILDPHGPRAGSIRNLWWLMLTVGTMVWIVVVFMVFLALFRRRAAADGERRDPVGLVLVAGAVIPLVIVVAVMVVSLRTLTTAAAEPGNADVVIEVVGHRWWWEVRYPNANVTTANEFHIPTGEPVRLTLDSADVIHSLWLPQLQGKMDMIPGRTNTLYIQADDPGTYRGECAEFCGLQHANMAFDVVAEPRADFEQWLSEQEKAAPRPTDASTVKGQQVFFGSACVYCHAISGTTSSGTIGPDLTHLMDRAHIGAGALENNRDNLGNWILDPQHPKPGNLMPATQMDNQSLQSLLDYLETLK